MTDVHSFKIHCIYLLVFRQIKILSAYILYED